MPGDAPDPVMNAVTLYTTPFCGYCVAAKRLLARKGIAFTEIDVAARPRAPRRDGRSARWAAAPCRRFSSASGTSAATTTCAALDRAGRLDPLLGP